MSILRVFPSEDNNCILGFTFVKKLLLLSFHNYKNDNISLIDYVVISKEEFTKSLEKYKNCSITLEQLLIHVLDMKGFIKELLGGSHISVLGEKYKYYEVNSTIFVNNFLYDFVQFNGTINYKNFDNSNQTIDMLFPKEHCFSFVNPTSLDEIDFKHAVKDYYDFHQNLGFYTLKPQFRYTLFETNCNYYSNVSVNIIHIKDNEEEIYLNFNGDTSVYASLTPSNFFKLLDSTATISTSIKPFDLNEF